MSVHSINLERGFITILTRLYSLQHCVHFLAAIRRFHNEPIVILIERVPRLFYPLLRSFKNIILKPALSYIDPVYASRQVQLSLYNISLYSFFHSGKVQGVWGQSPCVGAKPLHPIFGLH
jgi:hypothetical protein